MKYFIHAVALAAVLASPVLASDASTEKSVAWTEFPNWIESEFGKAADHGVTPFFNYWGMFQGNPVGGVSQNVAYAHEMLFGATFDMEKLTGWKGASFKISGAANSGRNLSVTIGNVFDTAESYVTPTGMFYEAYYAQTLFDDFLELRIGRMVAADLFCVLPAFGLQAGGGIDGNPTSLFLNSKFTSSPNATWGATVKINPSPVVYAASGIYQATDRLGLVAYHGLDFSIRPGDGILMFAETGWTPTFGAKPAGSAHDKDGKTVAEPAAAGLPGMYKFGGYYSDFPLASATGDAVEVNTFGFYLIAQQTVWQSAKNPNHNLALWGGVTYSPQLDVAQMPLMGFGGTVWQGIIPGRDQDQFLCTWLTGALGSAFAPAEAQAGSNPTAETVLEISYIINLTPNVFIQPDIQYIIQPNGTQTPNALVIGAQFGCNF